MREFYFVIEPVRRSPEKDMRVYSVEKIRKEEKNYQEASRNAEEYTKSDKKKTAEETSEGIVESKVRRCIQNRDSALLQAEMISGHNQSLEERQKQLAFQKREKESSVKRSQMLAAYK